MTNTPAPETRPLLVSTSYSTQYVINGKACEALLDNIWKTLTSQEVAHDTKLSSVIALCEPFKAAYGLQSIQQPFANFPLYGQILAEALSVNPEIYAELTTCFGTDHYNPRIINGMLTPAATPTSTPKGSPSSSPNGSPKSSITETFRARILSVSAGK